MSLYANYITERTDDLIVETVAGFATYRFLPDNKCYIIDIYVLPEYRKTYVASSIADQIVEIAKEKGCKTLLGTVCVNAKNADNSLKVLQAYGMTLQSAQNDIIIMKKEI